MLLPARVVAEALQVSVADRLFISGAIVFCVFVTRVFVGAAIDAGMITHVRDGMWMAFTFMTSTWVALLLFVQGVPVGRARALLYPLDIARPHFGYVLGGMTAVLVFNFLAMATLATMVPEGGVIMEDAGRDFWRPDRVKWISSEERTLLRQQVEMMSMLATVSSAICISAVF